LFLQFVMKKIFTYIDLGLARISIVLIRGYQYTLSPDKWLPSLRLKGKICCHEPHCSEYGVRTFKRYRFYKWIFKVMDRVYHCRGSMQKQYDPEHYRIVFFSSALIGVPFLEALNLDSRFETVGVVTTPDKPVGRGMKMQENIIKQTARNTSCDVTTPTKIRSKSEEWKKFISRLQNKKPDFIVVIAYGKIIPQNILDIPTIAPINIHGSLLPKYRGASPIQSVLLDGERETWVTIMKMAAGLDTGNMIHKLKFPLPFDRTANDIISKMKDVGPKFLCNTLWKYGKNMLWEVEQNEKDATLCSKIEKEFGHINPYKDSLEVVYKKYRGYFLRPKIYFFLNSDFNQHKGKRVVIEKLVLDPKIFDSQKHEPLLAGKKLHSAIQKISLKPEGKKALSWKEFIAGYWNTRITKWL